MKKIVAASLAAITYGAITVDQMIMIIGAIIGILNILLELLKAWKERKKKRAK